MIKHISMARYKEYAGGCSKDENMRKSRTMLEALQNKVPQIRKLEVGINILNGETDFDMVSYSEYEDMEAVRKTLEHPAHDELLAFLAEVTEVSHAVTFEV